MNALSTQVLCAIVSLMVTVPALTHTASDPTPQVAVVRNVVKILDDLAKFASKADNIAPAMDEVTEALKRIASSGGDISDELAILIKRDLWVLEATGTFNEALLKLLSRHPEWCDEAWDLAKRVRLRDLAPRLERIASELGDRTPKLLKALGSTIPNEQAVLFLRGISGRTLSRKQVVEIADALAGSGLDPRLQGEAFECLSRAQLSRGAKKSVAGLREGGEVVPGQFNGVHGIDGVGAAADGRPVIFEFSMDRAKALGQTVDGHQLSPSWTSARWNKAMDDPKLVENFRKVGVAEEYLVKVDPTVTKSWPRKLVVAHDSALTDANRMAAEIGPQDLFVLGGN